MVSPGQAVPTDWRAVPSELLKKKEVSRILGPPQRISRHVFKDLPQDDQKHLENRALSGSAGIEKWHFQIGMETVALYFLSGKGQLGMVDPGLLAINVL